MSNKTPKNPVDAIVWARNTRALGISAALVIGLGGLVVSRRTGATCQFASSYKTMVLQSDFRSINSVVADTDYLRQKGLSGLDCMPQDQGMLFAFNVPDNYSFWMKDMHFPIDIIWLDQDKRVVTVAARVDPSSYPRSFKPDTPSLYVLELSAGKAADFGIVKSSQLVWQ